MKRKLLVIFLCLVLAVLAFWMANRHFKLIDLSTINVTTDSGLDKSKIKIERGLFSISRKTDSVLFTADAGKWKVFDGHQCGLLRTDYGENDFLITYDNRYYLAFRHFITYGRFQHNYNLTFFRRGDTILVGANIVGGDGEVFTRPMRLIADAYLPEAYLEFRSNFRKDKRMGLDSTSTIPVELVNSFLPGKIDTTDPPPIEPLDWVENRYGNFFVIRINCGDNGECANYYLLTFDKTGKFVRKNELGRLSIEGDVGMYFDYKQLSDTTLKAHSSSNSEDGQMNADSTWVVPLKL